MDIQQNAPRPMSEYEKDGTLVILLVTGRDDLVDDNRTDDDNTWQTIGFNSFDHSGDPEWKMAGWCWDHDHFTAGRGKPIGWWPMPKKPATVCAYDAGPSSQGAPTDAE